MTGVWVIRPVVLEIGHTLGFSVREVSESHLLALMSWIYLPCAPQSVLVDRVLNYLLFTM
jgi:hypothetical protein